MHLYLFPDCDYSNKLESVGGPKHNISSSLIAIAVTNLEMLDWLVDGDSSLLVALFWDVLISLP